MPITLFMREFSPILERVAAASVLVIALVVIAKMAAPRVGMAGSPAGALGSDITRIDPHSEEILLGELVGRDLVLRFYAGEPIRYTLLDDRGRMLAILHTADELVSRFPDLPIEQLLAESGRPAVMFVDPGSAHPR